MELTRRGFLRSAAGAGALLSLDRLVIGFGCLGPEAQAAPPPLPDYRGWENYQFEGGKGFQNLIPSPINPIELAGGEGHLRPISICLQPSQNDRDTRVEVSRVSV